MNKPNNYQALLFTSFGGPEGRDEVMPFLENVVKGRNVPRERLLSVAEHYYHFDGISPINQQNRDLIEALKGALNAEGIDLPIYFGNRNWKPCLVDAVKEMKSAGIKKALAFVTSGFSCYSGCRQYRENIQQALTDAEATDLEIGKIRVFFNHPLFVESQKAIIRDLNLNKDAHLVFCAHSIPEGMASNSDYEKQLEDIASLISKELGFSNWSRSYQSRSGSPRQPWLEPDISDHLKELAESGVRSVCVVPLGFISDHMEVLNDLDQEAKEAAGSLGLQFVRAPTPGTHPLFVKMIVELVKERLFDDSARPVVGGLAAKPDACLPTCCLQG